MIEFTSEVVKLRHDYPVFRRRTYFDGRPVAPAEGLRLPDILWLNADGTPSRETSGTSPGQNPWAATSAAMACGPTGTNPKTTSSWSST